jgi:hypothetical protein
VKSNEVAIEPTKDIRQTPVVGKEGEIERLRDEGSD